MISPPKAYENIPFLNSAYCRPVRLQLEYLHPEVTMVEEGVKSTIVLFGSARIPSPEKADSCTNEKLASLVPFYEEARKPQDSVSPSIGDQSELDPPVEPHDVQ